MPPQNVKRIMEKEKRLDELSVGECGVVENLIVCGSMRRRLLDIGFTRGTTVLCVGKSPLGDPTAYLVRGCKIAIRQRDAHGIVLK